MAHLLLLLIKAYILGVSKALNKGDVVTDTQLQWIFSFNSTRQTAKQNRVFCMIIANCSYNTPKSCSDVDGTDYSAVR